MPQFKYGFADSHFICFPYETRRTGIYAAGPVRRPMDMLQAQEDATGAALKAIQAVENVDKGRAAHPRAWDLSFPNARLEGCTQCKRCTVECPFGAIDEDEKRFPVFNEERCRRCGTCMGACPVRVISFENYSCDTVGMQVKAVNVPDEFEEKPRILILACENDAYPALDMAGVQRITYSAFVRAIPVRCLGSVNTIWITDALNSGYDGVMMMGCKKGDDYQCHFVKGSEMAYYRMSKIGDTLKQLGLEPERVQTQEVAITDSARVATLINEYVGAAQRNGSVADEGLRLRRSGIQMSDLNTQAVARYKNNFLKEVEERVEDGHWVKMCMQCGVCAGSCPLGPHWEHSPQKIFMMIRAGKREEVLTSDSMWMCTSCYNCIVRCPRKLPITHIMHGLANYAHRLDMAPKGQPTREIAKLFWDNLVKTGRVNELKFSLAMYFKDGFGQGVKNAHGHAGYRPGPGQGQAAQPDGNYRRPQVQGQAAASRRWSPRRAKSKIAAAASPDRGN